MKAVMYHYVREEREDLAHFRYLHIRDFENQLNWMSSHGGFVSKEQFFDYVNGKDTPRGFLLTFDDGLKDHINFVLPHLVERGIWAIFFGCSNPLTDPAGALNVHIVHYLMGRWGAELFEQNVSAILESPIEQLVPANIYSWQSSDWKEKAIKYLFNYALPKTQAKRYLDDLLSQLDTHRTALSQKLYLSSEDYRYLTAAGMTVAAHSCSHPVLAGLDTESSLRELSDSITYFDQYRCHEEPRGFCFPYGVEGTFGPTQLEQLANLDVRYCFAVKDGDIDSHSQPLALPRYDCNYFPHGKSTLGTRIHE